jgi:hypothetical protein
MAMLDKPTRRGALGALLSSSVVALPTTRCAAEYSPARLRVLGVPRLTVPVTFEQAIAVTPGCGVLVSPEKELTIIRDTFIEITPAMAAPKRPPGKPSVNVLDLQDNEKSVNALALRAEVDFFVKANMKWDIEEVRARARRAVYVMIEVDHGSEALPRPVTWSKKAKLPAEPDPAARLAAFLDTKGSHFCDAIHLGWRVCIRAEVTTESKASREEVKAALSGAFFGKFDFELQKKTFSELTAKKVALTSSAFGRFDRPGRLIAVNIDEVLKLVAGLQKQPAAGDDLIIEPGPIKVELVSYANVLQDNHPEWSRLLRGDRRAEVILNEIEELRKELSPGPPPVIGRYRCNHSPGTGNRDCIVEPADPLRANEFWFIDEREGNKPHKAVWNPKTRQFDCGPGPATFIERAGEDGALLVFAKGKTIWTKKE